MNGPTADLPAFYAELPPKIAASLAPIRRGLNRYDEQLRLYQADEPAAVAHLRCLETMMASLEGSSGEKPREFAPAAERYAALRGRLAHVESIARGMTRHPPAAPTDPNNRDFMAHFEPTDHAEILKYMRANPGVSYQAAEQFVAYGR